MIGTYAAVLAVCAASLALGQGALALCGARRWSWLAPPIGLALLMALCWATVRLPGEGGTAAAVTALLTALAGVIAWRRTRVDRVELRAALPAAALALAAASLPFAVEGHFGILGTGFNPDMSQHMLAADRLADGSGSQLAEQGYPLGPHAVAVALGALGIGLVHALSGLTVAVAVLAPLTALAAFGGGAPRRALAALAVGLPYLVASYFAQGAFKETTEALLVLAFVLALREAGRDPAWPSPALRFVPAALIAIGAVYAYSFPGLVWLAGIAVVWALAGRRIAPGPLLIALAVFAAGTLPELGRMIDFRSFETFDPSGPGLGNLFGQVSPFTALGIWFSGDFRVAPGDGAVPALAYYLGAAFAAALLVWGLVRLVRARERAILAGVATVAAVYVAARLTGTPYQAAKALEVAAPLLALAIVLPPHAWRPPSPGGEKAAGPSPIGAWAGAAYLLLALGCSLLAFANAPVGPTEYSPALTGLRPHVAAGSTLVLAPEQLLGEEHGARYIAWELRGGRVCIDSEARSTAPPPGVRWLITWRSSRRHPPAEFRVRRRAGPYLLWERRRRVAGPGPCPLIAVRQARRGD